VRKVAPALVLACALVACGTSPEASAPTSPLAAKTVAPAAVPVATPVPTPEPAPAPRARHVFVIVMENRAPAEALEGRYIASLAREYAIATSYFAISRPSLPNYLALTAGDTFGILDDAYHALAKGGLGTQLTAAGLTWRAYMEGMTKGCFDSPYPYALKHNPFAYYGGGCPDNVVPLSALAADLAGATPRFVWITPDMCHDGHDCAVADADAWLSRVVPEITASRAWRDDGVLFITWDESDARNQVPLIVVAPTLVRHSSDRRYDHYSLLATVQDVLGVPRLGQATGVEPLADLVTGLAVAGR